ncbi:hypothetical protein [Haliscomenobacter sp.]|uniref:hypothetical protein n=1 Tax=Haliscomenobacter sp. TaxID=2717303 RepID=UPI003593EE4B
MQKLDSTTNLNDAILELETRRAEEGKMLKEHVNQAYESIKPINLIRSTFKEAIASQDLREDIINLSLGLVAGYVSKKVFSGLEESPLKKLLGTSLQFGITLFIVNNPETIQAIGDGIIKFISGDQDQDQQIEPGD